MRYGETRVVAPIVTPGIRTSIRIDAHGLAVRIARSDAFHVTRASSTTLHPLAGNRARIAVCSTTHEILSVNSLGIDWRTRDIMYLHRGRLGIVG